MSWFVDAFHRPYILLALILVPLLGWRLLFPRAMQSVAFSTTSFFRELRPTWRQRLTWVPPCLYLASLSLLIVALAGPREGRELTVSDTEGIAIELLVDRSSSMQAMDFKIGGTDVDRLTAIKDVAGRFVLGDGKDLAGRSSDLVGLITFAGKADGVTPPTLDHPFMISQLLDTQIVSRRSEDGTAIGDAIGLAVEKLAALGKKQDKSIESRIAILLTDGENTAGELDPMQAADLAKTLEIKVYTIGVGTRGRAKFPVRDLLGRQAYRMTDVNIDEELLQKIAETTGGKYFRATSTTSLTDIYSEIDRLEKSKVEERRYTDYRELAVQPIRIGSLAIPSLTWWALMGLGLQLVLRHTVFRRIDA